MRMSKLASMTTGLVLILIGAQLYFVKSYLLTPSATRFVAENMSRNTDSRFSTGGGSGGLGGAIGSPPVSNGSWVQPPGQKWPYYGTNNTGNGFGNASTTSSVQSASYGRAIPPGYQHRVIPPQWIMWPSLFLGVVLFLHGLALRSQD